MGFWKRMGNSVDEHGVVVGVGGFVSNEFKQAYRVVSKATESSRFSRVLKPLVKQIDNQRRNYINMRNKTKHTADTDAKHVDFIDRTKSIQGDLNSRMTFKTSSMGLDPKTVKGVVDVPTGHLHLSGVSGIESKVGIIDSNYAYLKDNIDTMGIKIPTNVKSFYEDNVSLHNEQDTAYTAMAHRINQLTNPGDKLVIAGAPYIRSEIDDLQINPTAYVYEGAQLDVLRDLAQNASRERNASEISIGDYTWAHLEYTDMKQRDKGLVQHLERSVGGMGLTPTKVKEEPLRVVQDTSSVPNIHPTWEQLNAQYKRDNPDYVARQEELAAEIERAKGTGKVKTKDQTEDGLAI